MKPRLIVLFVFCSVVNPVLFARAQTPIKFNIMVNCLDKMPISPASTIDAYTKTIRDKTGYLMKDEFDDFLKQMKVHLKEIRSPVAKSETMSDVNIKDDASHEFRETEELNLIRDADSILAE